MGNKKLNLVIESPLMDLLNRALLEEMIIKLSRNWLSKSSQAAVLVSALDTRKDLAE